MELAFDLSAAQRAEAQRALATRGGREASMICAGIVAGASLSVVWPVGSSPDGIARAGVGILLALASYGIALCAMRIWDWLRAKLIAPAGASRADDLIPGERRWALTKSWIAEDGPTGVRAFRWDAVLDAFKTRSLLVVVISEREALAIPLEIVGKRGSRAIIDKARASAQL